MATPHAQLLALIETFITGADRSLQFAGEIEVLLDNSFPDDDDTIDDAVIALACYNPAGGPFIHDEHFIAQVLMHVKEHILTNYSADPSES